jgi:hypothetical protein
LRNPNVEKYFNFRLPKVKVRVAAFNCKTLHAVTKKIKRASSN